MSLTCYMQTIPSRDRELRSAPPDHWDEPREETGNPPTPEMLAALDKVLDEMREQWGPR